MPKEIKHTVHESHSHVYELDISAFAKFIEERSGFIMLVVNGNGDKGYRSVSSWEIIELLNDFRDATLPEAING